MSVRVMIAASALLVLWTGIAPAQPPPGYDADKAAAEQLFVEGRQLMQRREFAAACRKFKASFDLDPATGTQLNLADCYVKIGRLASAWGHYTDAAVRAGQANRPDREQYARTRAAALEPRLPRLRIDMDGAAQLPGLVIERDGERVPLELIGSSVYIDPGEHEITALAPGFAPFSVKVRAVEGKSSSVLIPRLTRSARAVDDAQRARGQEHTSAAAIKRAVVTVRPHYHDSTRALFERLSDVFADAARGARATREKAVFVELARLYHAHADSPGHGTGWLTMGADGLPWVITNKHVAGQAEHVTLDWAEPAYRPIEGCRVLYADPDVDLAVISVPPESLPPGAVGFELSHEPVEEGLAVAAAGFPGVPGYRNRPIYQYTAGIVNNAAFPMLGGTTSIQHSASIDPGNSGGPLLVMSAGAALGYRVIGVNTWTIEGRTNVNLAIPASAVATALTRAQAAHQLRGDRARLAAALRSSAELLAEELGSGSPDEAELYEMISYEWVSTRGAELMTRAFAALDTMSSEELELFLANPVEHMRRVMFVTFIASYASKELAGVRLEQISEHDLAQLDHRDHVRTVYSISGRREEVTWVFEHGAWKISDATFTRAVRDQAGADDRIPGKAAASGDTRRRGLGLVVGAGLGSRTAEGDLLTAVDGTMVPVGTGPAGAVASALTLLVDVPLGRYLGIRIGVGYVNKGLAYSFTSAGVRYSVDESLYYVQLPASLRFEVPLEIERVILRPRVEAGAGLDLLMKKVGTGTVGGTTIHLDDIWYDGHSESNLSLLLGGGLDVGLDRWPGIFFGVDVVRDTHLLSEWRSTRWDGQNHKYQAWYIGGRFTFQLPRSGR